jgi:hypothetical protein
MRPIIGGAVYKKNTKWGLQLWLMNLLKFLILGLMNIKHDVLPALEETLKRR